MYQSNCSCVHCKTMRAKQPTVCFMQEDHSVPHPSVSGNRNVHQENPAKYLDNVSKLRDLLTNNEKHPVSVINELTDLLNKNKVEYSTENLESYKIYTSCAKGDHIVAYGIGASKKAAKKNAAINFLQKFSYTIDDSTGIQFLTEQSKLNHVGYLQNVCMARRVPFPDYRCIEDCKTQNCRFTVKCFLCGIMTKGNGKTKSDAKRLAASRMYDRIKDMSADEINAFSNRQTTNYNNEKDVGNIQNTTSTDYIMLT